MEIQLIVIDIDGTLTDGGIYYGCEGLEIKKFNVKDAVAILGVNTVGIDVMFLTGRESEAVSRRSSDLNVKYCIQGQKDKLGFLKQFLNDKDILTEKVLYIGDDINDLAAMCYVGHAACPCDAAEEVAAICEYISGKPGGQGAVRDVIFHYLRVMGKYEEAKSNMYGEY
ncbi:MAG: HAD-IIIA family hydrolase [Lachnospiraceae bacterium]|nr:HAD-IIIA family hydrolase [Lachnospiraceae bacterium]